MQARLFQVIAPGHAADGDHAADVLDGRRQSDRNDEQNRLPVEFRCGEVRYGQPRCVGNLLGIDHAEVERQRETHQYARNDRHQTKNPLAEHRHD